VSNPSHRRLFPEPSYATLTFSFRADDVSRARGRDGALLCARDAPQGAGEGVLMAGTIWTARGFQWAVALLNLVLLVTIAMMILFLRDVDSNAVEALSLLLIVLQFSVPILSIIALLYRPQPGRP
jgi:hypothetical protein